VDKTTVSKINIAEESLATFKHLLDINSFAVDTLSSNEINEVHEKAMEYLEFQFSKLRLNLKNM
jgi:hypothetical protein